MLRLQPFEVVDLVPLVGLIGRRGFDHLSPSIWLLVSPISFLLFFLLFFSKASAWLLQSMNQGAGGTHICFRQGCKLDPPAIFDDGSTTAVQVDDTVPTFVHSELPRGYNEDTPFHACHMRRAIHMTAHYQALFDIFECQAGERSAVGRGDRHIDDTMAEVCE